MAKRAALTYALLLALSTTCALGRRLHTLNEQEEIADVLVIGAGMAGVTLARNLSDSGFNVMVVEVSDGL